MSHVAVANKSGQPKTHEVYSVRPASKLVLDSLPFISYCLIIADWREPHRSRAVKHVQGVCRDAGGRCAG